MENTENIEIPTEDIVVEDVITEDIVIEDIVSEDIFTEDIEVVEKPKVEKNIEKSKPAKEKDKPEKLAVYSERNLYKYELGDLAKGYSILPADKAEAWLKSTKKVRIATPEEVARYYNN
jgi:hypothetical protein